MIAILLDHLGSHPEQARIIQHELARQQALPARARQWVAFLFSSLTRLIAEGQTDGSIIAGPPGLLAAAAVAQPFYLNMTGRAWPRSPAFPTRHHHPSRNRPACSAHGSPHARRSAEGFMNALSPLVLLALAGLLAPRPRRLSRRATSPPARAAEAVPPPHRPGR